MITPRPAVRRLAAGIVGALLGSGLAFGTGGVGATGSPVSNPASVFAPGLAGHSPQLTAPVRRPFRPGALLRLKSGDLGLGFAGAEGALTAVSLSTGLKSEGYDLVFDRWTLSLRRAGGELLVGAFRPI